MIRIIDRTLIEIDKQKDAEGEQLYEMCELLVNLGISSIELSIPILKKMGRLPAGGHYLLRINNLEERKIYPDFEGYVWGGKTGKGNKEGFIYEIEASFIEEAEEKINQSKLLKETESLRLTGFGDMIFRDYEEEIRLVRKKFRSSIDFCPRDSRYSATALGMEWLMAGGKSISVSFNGVGGLAKLEEVLMGIKVIMKKKIRIDLSLLPELCRLYEEIMQVRISYNKAVIGKNIFNVEAGVRDGRGYHQEFAYEPYDPALVGKRRKLVIGKYSGESAVKLKLREIGIHPSERIVQRLIESIREITMNRGRSLTDREFVYLTKEVMHHDI